MYAIAFLSPSPVTLDLETSKCPRQQKRNAARPAGTRGRARGQGGEGCVRGGREGLEKPDPEPALGSRGFGS